MTAPTTTAPPPPPQPAAQPPRRHVRRTSPLTIWFVILKSALKSLMANKLRSILAMLGIIIGVAAVIAMLAMGAGAQKQMTERFQAMGTNLLFVRPASRGQGGVITGSAETLSVADGLAIARLPGIKSVSPVVSVRVQAKYMNRNNATQIMGVAATYFEMRNFELLKGRIFTEAEAEQLGRVTVIGPNVARILFGEEEPIDKTIKYNNINFKVVGVLKPKGDSGWNNPDDQAMVPYSTAMKILPYGVDYLREIDIAVEDDTNINAVSGQPAGAGGFGPPGSRGGTLHKTPPPENSVTATLRARHKLNDLSTPDDFIIQNQVELLANVTANIMQFRWLLGIIAAISLLVGGIGIMNIMLVTVTERTREIGVRKAIGAKNRAILTQFVVEAIFMSGLGGLIGAGLGVGSSMAIAWMVRNTPGSVIPIPTVQMFYVVLSVVVSGAVGIIFGVYPAYRAAQLDPIEALRYE